MDTEMKEMFGMILVKLDSLDNKVTKNSIEIESIKSDIKIIAEVQKAHMDQNERDHEKIITLIDNEIGLHSIIIKKTWLAPSLQAPAVALVALMLPESYIN